MMRNKKKPKKREEQKQKEETLKKVPSRSEAEKTESTLDSQLDSANDYEIQRGGREKPEY